MIRPLTPFERARQQAVEAGYATVARLHKGYDDALIQWAHETGHYRYIGDWTRQGKLVHPQSIWFNPYKEACGDHSIRVRLYADYLDGRPAPSRRLPKLPGPELLKRLPELAGMLLACWCVPQYACRSLAIRPLNCLLQHGLATRIA